MDARIFVGAKQLLYLELQLGYEYDFERTHQYLSYSMNYNYGGIVFNDLYVVEHYIPDIILKKYSNRFPKTTTLTSHECLMFKKLTDGLK